MIKYLKSGSQVNKDITVRVLVQRLELPRKSKIIIKTLQLNL